MDKVEMIIHYIGIAAVMFFIGLLIGQKYMAICG